jgi:hypothetical protein
LDASDDRAGKVKAVATAGLGSPPARGKRVIALTAALYADGELKGRKP